MILVRILVNALALLVITVLPDIHFVEPTVLRVLFVALILGVLNAFVKPIVQFLTLRFIFITFGFAVVIINAIMLLLLNVVVSNMFAVESLVWALVAGALMGLITGFLENLFGLQIPILPEGVAPQSSLVADSSRAFETMLVSGVVGPDEELTTEVSLANEPQDDAAQDDSAEDDAAQDDMAQDDAAQDDAADDDVAQDDAADDDVAQDDAADDPETPLQGEER
jgi:putative membrane protein